MLGREGALSEWGAGLYFFARLAYLLLYAAGAPLLRSVVWNIAFLGIDAASSIASRLCACSTCWKVATGRPHARVPRARGWPLARHCACASSIGGSAFTRRGGLG